MGFLCIAISPDEHKVRERIVEVQKRAEYPYPCVRAFHFANLFMAANPVYPNVVDAGMGGNTLFLDLGCHMGTDVRKLVSDGYPASNIIGCDLRPQYFAFGYELFGDADRCPIRFFAGNIFDLSDIAAPLDIAQETKPPDLASVTNLSQLRGTLTHIYTGALFHLFDEETQYGLALRLVVLLKRFPGAVEAGKIDDHLGRNRYGHSEASWPVMWKRVFTEVEGEAFADKVVVQAELREGYVLHISGAKRQHNMLYWSVRII
ncbi:hypothetical protein LXA43DRAFT_968581 [Ganoderma leucocontextum]|nr:hypothetical protein LXA43DRAFT_968581 [Ganoderma leucocontextum]